MKRQSSKFPAFSIQTIFFPFFEDFIKFVMGRFLDVISVSKSCGV